MVPEAGTAWKEEPVALDPELSKFVLNVIDFHQAWG